MQSDAKKVMHVGIKGNWRCRHFCTQVVSRMWQSYRVVLAGN